MTNYPSGSDPVIDSVVRKVQSPSPSPLLRPPSSPSPLQPVKDVADDAAIHLLNMFRLVVAVAFGTLPSLDVQLLKASLETLQFLCLV